jgi:hypothetical protein
VEFHEKCDVIVNPDMLQSGRKIKCVEALSFSKPLICTTAASGGLTARSPFHRARKPEECATTNVCLGSVQRCIYCSSLRSVPLSL